MDQDGNPIEFDVREDEEQGVKFNQTVELLLAAGYFRARIKGLTPFDKVVGGMTWCITTCNVDIDVDLLFQENSTIGQKIALTEKIVGVLPRMKCPHRIEPHQIQGLDFIHIFPVVQWLVQRAIETREEMGDYIRAYSVSQFDKYHTMPEDAAFQETKQKSMGSVRRLQHTYRPERRYRRHDNLSLEDEETRVESTLLEYGQTHGLSKARSSDQKGKDKKQKDAEKDEDEIEAEQRIKTLLSGMSSTEGEGRLTASAIGSIVGIQSEEIHEMASKYAEKQAELDVGVERGGVGGGAQHHQRQVTALQKQIQTHNSQLQQVEAKHQELKEKFEETQQKLLEAEAMSARIDEEMEKLNAMETEENRGVLETLRHLVAMNENLKRQEQQFKLHCKEEMTRLQEDIAKLKEEEGVGDADDQERGELIARQLQADKDKLQKIRLLLARKNREISGLQRKVDEVPTRAELSQYQRRFVELYNQVAATHKETKQFYTLYNTLDDSKLYLDKEITLLNSIYDNFTQAMTSPASREQFLKQMESIVEGVKTNKAKLERRKQDEKMRRDQLNDQHLNLLEKKRLYFKTVKEFQEECRKNEILLAKLQAGR